MNLLAHLYLSANHPIPVQAGNLLADFLRRTGAHIPDDAFAAGVRLHRSIDAYADAHAATRAARRLIPPPRRRLAGIIVDVAYDYFLTHQWEKFSPDPLADFVEKRLADIHAYLRGNSAPLHDLLTHVIRGRWLLSYGSARGLKLTFQRMASRAPVAAGLLGADRDIAAQLAPLQCCFEDFFPDLLARFPPNTPEIIRDRTCDSTRENSSK